MVVLMMGLLVMVAVMVRAGRRCRRGCGHVVPRWGRKFSGGRRLPFVCDVVVVVLPKTPSKPLAHRALLKQTTPPPTETLSPKSKLSRGGRGGMGWFGSVSLRTFVRCQNAGDPLREKDLIS